LGAPPPPAAPPLPLPYATLFRSPSMTASCSALGSASDSTTERQTRSLASRVGMIAPARAAACRPAAVSSRRDSAAISSSPARPRSEEHTPELQSRFDLVCRLLLE